MYLGLLFAATEDREAVCPIHRKDERRGEFPAFPLLSRSFPVTRTYFHLNSLICAACCPNPPLSSLLRALQAKVPHPWQAVFDEDSGLYYFWNEETDEVTWQHPVEKVKASEPP